MATNALGTRSRSRQRTTTDVSTVAARNNFSDVINRAAYGKERVVLTRRGKPIAAIIPSEDLERLIKGDGDDRHEVEL